MPTYSQSQSTTYWAGGLDTDVSPIITRISPDDTPFLSRFQNGPAATQLSFDWLEDQLRPPGKNAHLEVEDYRGADAAGIGRNSNTIQFFKKSVTVSDAMQKVGKEYDQKDEIARQTAIIMKEMALDMEYALATSNSKKLETAGVTARDAAITGGVPFFMQDETQAVTFATTGDACTTATAHGLRTGDFIIFHTDGVAGSALPTNITAGERYYVRLSSTNPSTAFNIFPCMEDAIENTTANKITPATAGTGTLNLLKNNVIDAGAAMYTANMINDAMELAYYRGGNPTLAVMSGPNKRRFSQIMNTLGGTVTSNRNSSDKRAADVVTSYEGDYGVITAMAHRMFDDNRIELMDMGYWSLRWFDKPHRVANIPKKGTYTEVVYEAALGLQGTQPLASAHIKNILRP